MFRLKFPAAPTPGTDYLVNQVGIRAIKEIRLVSQGQVVRRQSDDTMYVGAEATFGEERLAAWRELVGDASRVARVQAAASEATYYCVVDMIGEQEDKSRAALLDSAAQLRPLRIEVVFHTPSYWSSNAAWTTPSVELMVDEIHAGAATLASQRSQIFNQGDFPILAPRLIPLTRQTVAAGTENITIDLEEIQDRARLALWMVVMVRNKADVDSGTYDNLLEVQSFNLESGGVQMTESVDRRQALWQRYLYSGTSAASGGSEASNPNLVFLDGCSPHSQAKDLGGTVFDGSALALSELTQPKIQLKQSAGQSAADRYVDCVVMASQVLDFRGGRFGGFRITPRYSV